MIVSDASDHGWVCWTCDALVPATTGICPACATPRFVGDESPAAYLERLQPEGARRSSSSPLRAVSTAQIAAHAGRDRRDGRQSQVAARASRVPCEVCSAPIPTQAEFCVACGARFAPPQTFAPGEAALVSLREGRGTPQNKHFVVHAPGVTVGSGAVDMSFPTDRLLGARHARFFYRGGHLYVRDEGTLNGTFVWVRGTVQVFSGDAFICGAQLLRFVQTPPRRSEQTESVRLLSSPDRRAPFRVEHVLRGGGLGSTVHARNNRVLVGRESCDLSFPYDVYMSGQHASVERLGDAVTVLMDLGSKNGTFRRIRNVEMLRSGDLVFVGRQLFRVE